MESYMRITLFVLSLSVLACGTDRPPFPLECGEVCSETADCPDNLLCSAVVKLCVYPDGTCNRPVKPDAGTPTDAGEVTLDAGEPLDAGEVTPDAGEPLDAGEVVPDAGEGTPDAGEPTPDAGVVPPDAGVVVCDGALLGVSLGPDRTVQLGDRVLAYADQTASVPRDPVFYWYVMSVPQGSQIPVNRNTAVPSTSPEFTFLPDKLGEYIVAVSEEDAFRCKSQKDQVVFNVVDGLNIELTWPETHGDLDLHYVGPAGIYNDRSTRATDTYYGSLRPDWGLNNTTAPDQVNTNDPRFMLDAQWGFGPERIGHQHAFNATYTVVVNYFCSRFMFGGVAGANKGAATANVKIRNGTTELFLPVASRPLRQRDVWTVATITVLDGIVTVTPVNTIRNSTAANDGCTADRN